jgi:hypothetical protein
MAYAGDLKSPDAHASCGFDPHPGHHFVRLEICKLYRSRADEAAKLCTYDIVLTAGDNPVATPEPGTTFLAGTALLVAARYARKKRTQPME